MSSRGAASVWHARLGRGGFRGLAATAAVASLVLLGPGASEAATVTLAWDANTEPDLAGYYVYYDTDSGEPYEGTQANEGPSPIQYPLAALSDSSAPEVQLTGLPSCETFYFAATAYDTGGLESGYSEEVSDVVVDGPDPVTATPSAPFTLEIEWAPLPSDDEGSIRFYEVHYDTDSGDPYRGPGSPIARTPASLTEPDHPSHDLTGLEAGTTYYIAVKAVCPGDVGDMSEEVTGVPTSEGTGGGGNVGGAGGGATGGTGGSGNTGATGTGVPGFSPDGEEESGCGCRVARPTGGLGRVATILAAVALGALRRRRRR